jgi:hypothetical protein
VGDVEDVEMKKLSNGYLDTLWSRAVKTKWNHCCALCFATEGLESHHVVHRRRSWVMRWEIKNGVALCHKCHSLADTINYMDRIRGIVEWDWLGDMQVLYPVKYDYLLANNITEEEFRQARAEELRGIINGEK